jgi:hypothetical protein
MGEEKFLIIVVIVLIFWMYKVYFAEQFANKQEKANAIHSWFAENKNPTYTKYKKDMSDPNVVEYENVLALAQTHKLTVGNVVSTLN